MVDSCSRRQSETPTYRYVFLARPAPIRDGVSSDDVLPIVRRYVPDEDVDVYLVGNCNEKAVVITMRPETWLSADHSKRYRER